MREGENKRMRRTVDFQYSDILVEERQRIGAEVSTDISSAQKSRMTDVFYVCCGVCILL